MIIAIYDLKVSNFPDIVEIVNCKKVTPELYKEQRFPCSDTTLEFIYVGY